MDTPDKNCYTIPDGSCVGTKGCMHDDVPPTGAELIAAERQRQVEAEGWTAEHDDQHRRGQLAWAAACYAAPTPIYQVEVTKRTAGPGGTLTWSDPWPHEYSFDVRPRPDCNRVQQLVRAGALIAAEIDRLLRQERALGDQTEDSSRG